MGTLQGGSVLDRLFANKRYALNSVDPLSARDEGRFDFISMWLVVWRYKYMIAAVTLVCGVVALLVAFTATPSFHAETAVTQVSNHNMSGAGALASQFGGLASMVGVNLGSVNGPAKEADGLLKSRMLCEEFVKRYDLRPILFKNAKHPPSLWFAVRQFQLAVLTVRDDKRSGLTIVSVNWTDPVVAARWANDFVALANEMLLLRAIAQSKASIAYLDDQIAHTNVVEIQRVMYNLIESETKTLMLANVKPEYAFAVVDPAVPPEVRASPQRTLLVLLGLMFGGVMGAVIAFSHNAFRKHRAAAKSSP
jgi:uncharacterized protein involved in exopolysaccharide biosynthesis